MTTYENYTADVNDWPELESKLDGSPLHVFTASVNRAPDVVDIGQSWIFFVSTYLDTPFVLDYYQIMVLTRGFRTFDHEEFRVTTACAESAIANDIFDLITVASDGMMESKTCGGLTSLAGRNSLCWNCGSTSRCSDPANGIIALPEASSCNTGQDAVTKYSIAVLFYNRDYIYHSVPIVLNISLAASSQSITVNATVLSTYAGGTLYCRPYRTSRYSLSFVTGSFIKAGGYSAPIQIARDDIVNINMVMTDLVASRDYTMFCYVEDAFGNGGTRADIIGSKRQVTTACCRDVVFTDSPSSLKREFSAIFSYTIPVYPASETSLTIAAAFYRNGTAVTGITVVPSHHIYTGTNRNLGASRSFRVSVSAEVALGEYILVLSLSGSASSIYQAPPSFTVQMLDSGASLHAPALASARFADSGGFVSVCFDKATDYASSVLGSASSMSWHCSSVFSFTGGAYTSCAWTSDRCVRMIFCGASLCAGEPDRSALELLQVGEKIALKANTVKSSCFLPSGANCSSSLYALSHSISVAAPALPLEPVVYITAPSIFNTCGSVLVIDPSATYGSGGRAWKYIDWDVDAILDSDVSDILAVLNASPISSTISIPREFLLNTTYTFTLLVTNFFGLSAFASVDVEVSAEIGSRDIHVVFDGPSFRGVYSYEEFVASAFAVLPECSSTSVVTYSWKLYKDTLYVEDIFSSSVDPRVMKLPPYTLEPGETYYFYVTAATQDGARGSALLEVPVQVGSAYVSIRGADRLLIAAGAAVNLDASASVLEDVSPEMENSVLLTWKCAISVTFSEDEFGDDCSEFFQLASYDNISSEIIVPIETAEMTVGTEYIFTATALSGDDEGDAASASVSVTVVSNTSLSPYVSILSSFNKFLASETLRISGELSGIQETVYANWSLYDNSKSALSLADVATTSVSKKVIATSVTHSYALSARPNAFSPGRTYTFRLTAVPVSGEWLETYAEIDVTANGPPHSGGLFVYPLEGVAMTSKFDLNAPYWVDDISDYPILYTFRYSLQSTSATQLSLGLSSQRSYVNSFLPAGLDNSSGLVYCSVLVFDFFGATTQTSATAVVRGSGSGISNSTQLSAQLVLAGATGNLGTLMQTISTVSSDLAVSDCSSAPNCAALNRKSCDGTPHTCSGCLDGFTGALGASNTECHSELSVSPPSAGDFCSHHKDCAPLLCLDGLCLNVNKTCPSISVDECSGAGRCLFYDRATDLLLRECMVDNANCISRCTCVDGRYGSACSMSHDEYTNRAASRVALCDSLYNMIGIVDWSSELLSYLSSALRQTFRADEVASSDGLLACLNVLGALTNISDAGYLTNNDLYLDDGSASAQENILETISEFLAFIRRAEDSVQDDGDNNVLVDFVVSKLNDMLESLTTLMSSDMVGGESVIEIVSTGVRLSVTFSDQNDLSGAILHPPLSDTTFLPSIILPDSGLKACSGTGSGDYVRLSIMEWQQNPFPSPSNNTTPSKLMSRIFRFSSIGERSPVTQGSGAVNTTYNTTYELILHYTSPQNWTAKSPDCATYDVSGEASICPCNVVSYDENKVHFLCSNLLDLCPPVAVGRRRASSRDLNVEVGVDSPLYGSHRRRRLDFDYEGEADDDAGAGTSDVLEYGALVKSLQSEFVSNLGVPQSFDLTEAIPAMSIVFGIILVFICGGFLFSRWDEKDYNYVRYVMNAMAEHRVLKTSTNVDLQAAFKSRRLKPHLLKSEIYGYRYDSNRSDDATTHTNTWDVSQVAVRYDPNVAMSMVHPTQQHTSSTSMVNAVESIRPSKSRLPRISELFNKRETAEDRWKRYLSNRRLHQNCDERCGENDCSDTDDDHDNDGGGDDDDSVFKIPHQLSELSAIDPGAFSQDFYPQCVGMIQEKRDIDGSDDESSYRFDTLSESEISQPDLGFHKNAVSTFFDNALPPSSLLESKSGWIRFWQAILREHDWIRCFTYPSLRLPRLIRYLTICTEVMIILFVDSLFYGILFEDDGSCERMSGRYDRTEDDCLSLPSRMQSSLSRCVWNDKTSVCELRAPPSTIQFYMVVSILITLLTVLPNVVCALLLSEICSLRPLFRSEADEKNGRYASDPVEKKARTKVTRPSELGTLLRNIGTDSACGIYRDMLCYIDYTTVPEEANILMNMADRTVRKSLQIGSLPWRVENLTSKIDLDKVNHALNFLGLYPDGSPLPLTWMQWLTFGTPRRRIERKLQTVRSRAKGILEDMEMFVEGEEDCKDTLLIQNFILEQLSPFKRYALRHEFFQVDTAVPGYVNGYVWLMAWAFIVTVWLFLVYWVIMWALNNSDVTVTAWAYQIVFVVFQEIFINEMLQIFIVHVVVIEALRPQLRRIYFALNTIILSKMEKAIYAEEEVCVVQHMSAACRAARKNPDLPAAQLLMRVDDSDAALCQHNREISLGWLMSVVIAIPTLLALSHETVQQGIMDIVFPTMWCCFLLGNAYLFSISPILFAAPYIILIIVMCYRYCFLLPVRHKRARGADRERSEADVVLNWKNMNQSLTLSGDISESKENSRCLSGPDHSSHYIDIECTNESSSENESDDISSLNDPTTSLGESCLDLNETAPEILDMKATHDSKHKMIRSLGRKHLRRVPSILANKYLWHAATSSPRRRSNSPTRQFRGHDSKCSNEIRADTM